MATIIVGAFIPESDTPPFITVQYGGNAKFGYFISVINDYLDVRCHQPTRPQNVQQHLMDVQGYGNVYFQASTSPVAPCHRVSHEFMWHLWTEYHAEPAHVVDMKHYKAVTDGVQSPFEVQADARVPLNKVIYDSGPYFDVSLRFYDRVLDINNIPSIYRSEVARFSRTVFSGPPIAYVEANTNPQKNRNGRQLWLLIFGMY